MLWFCTAPEPVPMPEIHSSKAIGDSLLVQVDVHLAPRFIRENLWSSGLQFGWASAALDKRKRFLSVLGK
jgi:hypothetical protein